jgi:hypothetical protein
MPEGPPPHDDNGVRGPELTKTGEQEAGKRSALRPQVVYEAIRREGNDELRRSTTALAWSSLAAGLSMGFSLVGEGLLRSRLPGEPGSSRSSAIPWALSWRSWPASNCSRRMR